MSFPINSMVIFHSFFVNVYQRVKWPKQAKKDPIMNEWHPRTRFFKNGHIAYAKKQAAVLGSLIPEPRMDWISSSTGNAMLRLGISLQRVGP